MLYPPDRKLLSRMKNVQGELSNYVAIPYPYIQLFQSKGWDSKSVESSYDGIGVPIPISKSDMDRALLHLEELGCIKKPHSGDVYQVTYDGWYNTFVRRRELGQAMVTHVLFPSAVALVTTLLTLWLKL